MMFNPLAQKATKKCVEFLPEKFSVCEMGNQTFVGEKFNSVKDWYMHLGATEYLAIDTNTKKDAVIGDLNTDIAGAFEKSDLVTNNGTSEHLFNQAQVFKNIHSLCKLNGLMLHILPLTPWINHGFYNYNPIFFRDLARVNNYDILFYWIANRWADGREIDNLNEIFIEKNPVVLTRIIKEVYDVAPIHKDVFNVVCLRRTTTKSFKTPMQGKYIKDVEGNIPSK